MTSPAATEGRFTNADFVYLAKMDEYRSLLVSEWIVAPTSSKTD